MNAARQWHLGTHWLTGPALLGGLVLGAWAWQHPHTRSRTLDTTGWDIPRLVSHLRGRGL
jgi:hypothetical protein